MQLTDLAWIDETGYHYADYPSFLSYFTTQYQGIFGSDAYLEPDSQDGQWLAILAKAHFDSAARGAATYNSFSPVSAQGAGLARLVKINGLTKGIPTNSTVELTLIGIAGTPISGGIAMDTQNQKWLIPDSVIPIGGSLTVTATADSPGDITALAGTVTTIFTPTRGWQSVTNPTDATPGAPIESDAALRQRQAQSTAGPSLTVLEGTVAALSNLAGVTKVQPYENDTGTTDANGIPAHSVDFVVVGGTDADIAAAIALHKTPGGGTYGNTSISLFDSKGMPLTIHFDRAVTAAIAAVITIHVGQGWSNDYIPMIQAAVASQISAGQIGKTVKLNSLFTPAELLGTAGEGTFDIASITLGKNGGTPAAANVTLAYNENPVCPSASVSVIIT